MSKLSKRSLKNMSGIDCRLKEVIELAMERGNVDFTVIEGLRSQETQMKYYKEGHSQLDGVNKKSRHQLGLAFDFIPYPFKDWNDIEGFKNVGEELKEICEIKGYKCAYGGDWKSFKDYPHFELNS